MPWIKVSNDAHKDMKQYLIDIEGINLGELVEASFEFCMENLEGFEKFLELDTEEDEEQKEGESEGEDEEDQKDEDQ